MKRISLILLLVILSSCDRNGCLVANECLEKAAKLYYDGEVNKAVPYIKLAVKMSCPEIQQSDNFRHIVPEMQDGAHREGCYDAMNLYCLSLRNTKDDWHTLSCLYGYATDGWWTISTRPLAEKLLAEYNMTYEEYFASDMWKLDWYKEINAPRIKDIYGINPEALLYGDLGGRLPAHQKTNSVRGRFFMDAAEKIKAKPETGSAFEKGEEAGSFRPVRRTDESTGHPANLRRVAGIIYFLLSKDPARVRGFAGRIEYVGQSPKRPRACAGFRLSRARCSGASRKTPRVCGVS